MRNVCSSDMQICGCGCNFTADDQFCVFVDQFACVCVYCTWTLAYLQKMADNMFVQSELTELQNPQINIKVCLCQSVCFFPSWDIKKPTRNNTF